jgi:hypothetical protein
MKLSEKKAKLEKFIFAGIIKLPSDMFVSRLRGLL